MIIPALSERTWKIIGGCFVGLCVLGAVLFVASKTSNWWSMRTIDKLKANVNVASKDLANAQANVTADKLDEAVKLEKVKEAANAVIAATNATDAAKAETQKALRNLANVVNANVPVGTTADDIQRRLDELEGK